MQITMYIILAILSIGAFILNCYFIWTVRGKNKLELASLIFTLLLTILFIKGLISLIVNY